MDKIQKILIKAERKDLAQEYYKKVFGKIANTFAKVDVDFLEKMKKELNSISEQIDSHHLTNIPLDSTGRLESKQRQLEKIGNYVDKAIVEITSFLRW